MPPLVLRLAQCAALTGALSLAACGGGSGDGVPASTLMLSAGTELSVGAGTHPSAVVAADFNLDGRLDLAVANRTDDSVTVFLGIGDGTFGAGASFSAGVGGRPVALVAADLDADGRLDLAVANASGDDVVVLAGDGSGSFSLATTVVLAAGADASGLVAADLNADGLLDLAVADRGTGDVSVCLATAPGTFGVVTTYAVGVGFDASAITALDCDRDGRLDLAVASEANGSVAILLGNGGGTFAAATAFTVEAGAALSSVAAADLNADGDVDLAVTNRTTGEASVLLGDGNGAFAAAIDAAVGAEASAVAIGDFDRDGELDLAVALEATGQVKLLLGEGDGTFAPALTFGTGGSASAALAIGDLDANGSLDVAVANSASASVSILLGASHAVALSFTAAPSLTLGATFDTRSVVTADFDGDGRLDVAAANAGDGSVSIALGNGTGTFGAATQVGVGLGAGPVALATADLDGDGTLDLVVANGTANNCAILLGSGTGTFALSGTIALALGAQPSALVLGDFDEDGRVDVVVTNALLGNVSLALNAGGGTFAAAVSFALSLGFQGSAMATGDFDHDGHLDLAVTSAANGTVAILLGDGNGAFAAAAAVTVDAGSDLSGVAVADLNRDGDLDLAVGNATTGQVSVLLGTGTGTFGPAVDFGAGADASAIAVGDFNRDGRLDLAATLKASGRLRVLLGHGNGTFSAASDFTAGGGGSAGLSTADLNGDGRLDVVVANRTSGNVGVELGS